VTRLDEPIIRAIRSGRRGPAATASVAGSLMNVTPRVIAEREERETGGGREGDSAGRQVRAGTSFATRWGTITWPS